MSERCLSVRAYVSVSSWTKLRDLDGEVPSHLVPLFSAAGVLLVAAELSFGGVVRSVMLMPTLIRCLLINHRARGMLRGARSATNLTSRPATTLVDADARHMGEMTAATNCT